MGEGNGLRPLQMRIAWHERLVMLPGHGQQGLLDLFQQKIRNQGIGSKRHVTTMALNAADGDEHHIVLLKVFLCLRPGQICKSHIFYFLFIHNFEQKSELSGGRIARHPSITGQP